jgi:hypothetical protein
MLFRATNRDHGTQYKGIVAADQSKMTGEAFGMPFEFTLKKAK